MRLGRTGSRGLCHAVRMDVDIEHDATCNRKALQHMASRAADRIGHHPDVLVVGSGDLAQSVRDRLGVGEEYQAERDGGTVAAKTLSPDDERTTIIVSDWVITDAVGVKNDGMARIIGHELLHGVLHERSEQESTWVYSQVPNDLPWWLGVDDASDWELEQRLNASVLLYEFRVERAVHTVGWDLAFTRHRRRGTASRATTFGTYYSVCYTMCRQRPSR